MNIYFNFLRNVWPENDSFGRTDMPPEEEFLALREIFFADLGGKYILLHINHLNS